MVTLNSTALTFAENYFCSWDCSYDHPIKIVEKDNKKILQYELIGLNAHHIKVNKQFVNKTKTLYVTVEGKYKDELTEFENEINIKLEVDYSIYNSVTWNIADGILTLILHEIINDEPQFDVKERNPWADIL